ncbi:PKD-like family lipoprotein [Chitinophaga sp. RAB17]|uniref:PKD-like family lipoprotein n=1 Tax=Chitinophaga sp. RAB17 TaxID=3233049 RepID=UPI003F8E740A
MNLLKKIKALLPVIILLLAGCYKDKGNYTYTPIAEMTISGLPDTVNAILLDTLRLQPVITQPGGSNDRYNYEWFVVDYKANTRTSVAATLSLKMPVVAGIGSYPLVFRVTDKNTGISSTKQVTMIVKSLLSNGALLLEEGPQGGDLSQVTPEYKVYRHLYSQVNQGAMLSLPLKGIMGSYNDNNRYQQQVIFVNAGADPVMLDVQTYVKKGGVSQQFQQAPQLLAPGYYNCSNDAYVVNNGKIYGMQGATDNPIKFVAPMAGDYKVAPYLYPLYSWFAAFATYDEKNGQFAYGADAGGTLLYYPPANGSGAFDLNNVKKQFVYAARTTNEYTLWLMKDSNGKLYVYIVNPDSNTAAAAVQYVEVNNAPGMQSSGTFTVSTRVPQLYYGAANQLYLYDYKANSARSLYSMPANESITALQLLPDKTDNEWTYTTQNKLLAITWNGTESKLYYFDIEDTGELNGGKPVKMVDGFGKIVSLFYK